MKVFLKLCEMNLKKMLAFRANLFISLILMGMWVGAYVVLIEVIFYYTKNLAGWSKGETTLVLAFYYLIQNISDIFFKDNMEVFGQTVRRGELDFRITKPAPLRLLSFFWDMRFDHLAGLLITGMLFSYGLSNLGYTPSLLHFVGGLGAVVFSVFFYYSLLVIIASVTFWVEKNDTFNILIFNISQLARYPRSIYTNIVGKFLTFGIPIALVASVPTEIALKAFEPSGLILLATLSFVFYFISRVTWRAGIARYTSAN